MNNLIRSVPVFSNLSTQRFFIQSMKISILNFKISVEKINIVSERLLKHFFRKYSFTRNIENCKKMRKSINGDFRVKKPYNLNSNKNEFTFLKLSRFV